MFFFVRSIRYIQVIVFGGDYWDVFYVLTTKSFIILFFIIMTKNYKARDIKKQIFRPWDNPYVSQYLESSLSIANVIVDFIPKEERQSKYIFFQDTWAKDKDWKNIYDFDVVLNNVWSYDLVVRDYFRLCRVCLRRDTRFKTETENWYILWQKTSTDLYNYNWSCIVIWSYLECKTLIKEELHQTAEDYLLLKSKDK